MEIEGVEINIALVSKNLMMKKDLWGLVQNVYFRLNISTSASGEREKRFTEF